MCGIWAFLSSQEQGQGQGQGYQEHQELWNRGVKTLAARGPEGHKWLDLSGGIFCFTRLAINGLNNGMQPFHDDNGRRFAFAWMCNGEIYNAKEIEERIQYTSSSGSDCEVLGALWDSCRDPVAFARALDGVFAIMLFEKETGKFIISRDPYGVRPLYYSVSEKGWHFASERKALEPFVEGQIFEFPPGEVWTYNGSMEKARYHHTPWLKAVHESKAPLVNALVAAVEKRLMTQRPVAALLSGGIDSSLIAALVQKRLRELGKPALKTFSIGMAGGTDLAYARKVAAWIGSDHTEVLVTADEMFDSIPQVIRDIESYDVTTVRASVGNWMVARAIREQTDCKVVFNGDGSDEVFGSYMYFYRAPTDDAFEMETQRLLEEIHQYDVLRSDRSISSHGLEARTPFLDKQFVGVAMSYPTRERRPVVGVRMEKQLLREAFENSGLLPSEVIWRRKEAFSDGVSSQEKSWFEIIQEKLENIVPNDWNAGNANANANAYFPVPNTKEAFYYRSLFEKDYKRTGAPWAYWMPRWSPETTDPSARTLGPAGAGPWPGKSPL